MVPDPPLFTIQHKGMKSAILLHSYISSVLPLFAGKKEMASWCSACTQIVHSFPNNQHVFSIISILIPLHSSFLSLYSPCSLSFLVHSQHEFIGFKTYGFQNSLGCHLRCALAYSENTKSQTQSGNRHHRCFIHVNVIGFIHVSSMSLQPQKENSVFTRRFLIHCEDLKLDISSPKHWIYKDK